MADRKKTVRVPARFAESFEKAEEFVAEYFSNRRFDPAHGTIEIADERYLMVRAGAVSVDFFENALASHSEEDRDEALQAIRSLLFDIAHGMGLADAKKFASKMDLENPIEKLSAGPVHFAYAGWATVSILEESSPVPGPEFVLVYEHPESFESNSWLAKETSSDLPVCIMNAGYSSGWCEGAYGLALLSSELLCKAMGDQCCRFVMAPPDRIEGRIAEHIAIHEELKSRKSVGIPGFFERKKKEEGLRLENLNLVLGLEEKSSELREMNARLEKRTAERIATQKSLLAEQEWNAQVVEALTGGLIQVDKKGIIVRVNSEALRFMGYTEVEVLGRDHRHFSDKIGVGQGMDAEAAGAHFVMKTLSDGQKYGPAQLRYLTPTGDTLWGQFHVVPLVERGGIDQGEVTGAIITLLDTTARRALQERQKQIEASMQDKQRLESLGLLAGGIAHDFNNLLVGIMANIDLAKGRPETPASIVDVLDRVAFASEQASALTEQMLAFAGQRTFELGAVAIETVTSKMLKFLRASIAKDIVLDAQIQKHIPAVWADEAQMAQVVLNLITNACEALTEGGLVSIRLRSISFGPSGATPMLDIGEILAPGQYVHLEVEDSGAGMSPEVKARIFDPFFTTKIAGRGLGLAVLAGIVQAHHGGLMINSKQGQGTRASLFLPVADKELGSVSSSSQELDSGPNKAGIVLVIEDNEIVAETVQLMLEEAGYKALICHSRDEGIATFRQYQGRLSAVLMDWGMPGAMSGAKAIAIMKGVDSEVPLVVTSGYDLNKDIAGVDGILPKPFGVRELELKLLTLQKL